MQQSYALSIRWILKEKIINGILEVSLNVKNNIEFREEERKSEPTALLD